jgi:hypothetical protein
MVLRKKRGLSRLEFYHNARLLRRELTMLVLRDFGIHKRGEAFKKETGSEQPTGFYDELLQEFSTNIRQSLRNLMLNITAGNSIYPVTPEELSTRRMYQNAAIINCEQLLQELLYCADVMPVKASIFEPYIEKIEFEINLLKGWRKSNSKIMQRIIEAREKKLKKEENKKE